MSLARITQHTSHSEDLLLPFFPLCLLHVHKAQATCTTVTGSTEDGCACSSSMRTDPSSPLWWLNRNSSLNPQNASCHGNRTEKIPAHWGAGDLPRYSFLSTHEHCWCIPDHLSHLCDFFFLLFLGSTGMVCWRKKMNNMGSSKSWAHLRF